MFTILKSTNLDGLVMSAEWRMDGFPSTGILQRQGKPQLCYKDVCNRNEDSWHQLKELRRSESN